MLEIVAQEFLTVASTTQNSEPNISKTKRGFVFWWYNFLFSVFVFTAYVVVGGLFVFSVLSELHTVCDRKELKKTSPLHNKLQCHPND